MDNEVKKIKTIASSTLMVRHILAEADAAITAQSKAASKSKSDFIKEYLSASFGDLIDNFTRSSELVALMEQEISTITGRPLAENREYYYLLQLRRESDLQRTMMAACLSCRFVHSWWTLVKRVFSCCQGISLACILFIVAASLPN